MSNKTQLQTNNTKYASLIETLRGKATSGGEDVTDETNAYTTKLASLETAISALESELEGKASGGGSGEVQTASVYVDLSNGSQLTYVGSEGITTITNTITTVQMTVPSICCIRAQGMIVDYNISGECSEIFFSSMTAACIAITGNAELHCPSTGSGGGSDN